MEVSISETRTTNGSRATPRSQPLYKHWTAHRLCSMTCRTIPLRVALSTKTYPAAVVKESWEEHTHSVPGTNKRVRLVLGRSHPKQQLSSQSVFPPVNRCLKLQDEYETAELNTKVEQDSWSVPFNIKSMAGMMKRVCWCINTTTLHLPFPLWFLWLGLFN